GDKGDGSFLESAESEQVLEDVPTAGVYGVQDGLKFSNVYEEEEVVPLLARDGVSGPTRLDVGATSSHFVRVGCVDITNKVVGPKVLRTRKGDITINKTNSSSCKPGVQEAMDSRLGSKAHLAGPVNKAIPAKNHRKSLPGNKRSFSNLPYHKLCNLPRAVQALSRPLRKKSLKKNHCGKRLAEGAVESDSIHNSEDHSLSCSGDDTATMGINLEVVLTCQTKVETVSKSLCNSLWGSDECDWVALPAVGSSGGILSLWRKSLGSLVFSFSGEGFVGVCLDLADKQTRCGVINVYAKCNLADKRRMWKDILMTRRGFGGVIWCVVGDFNSVIDMTEQRGVGFDVLNYPSREMMEFGKFLSDMELVDMPITGRQFTWIHSNGVTLSRLDRILVSYDWF
ncbi:endonuclease/exonuclease/phosphatase family protein, partial [Trifolium medium]|nr:endonuclease/exonuclease/phosphatase family protein [Trifolium medium]